MLDQLFKTEQRARRKSGHSVRGRPRASTDSRNVQVKAAVRPSEKADFERLADTRGSTLSDLIRDFLLREAKREGIGR